MSAGCAEIASGAWSLSFIGEELELKAHGECLIEREALR